MLRTGGAIPLRIFKVAPGGYAKYPICRLLPARPDVFEKIRNDLSAELRLGEPVTFIQNTDQRLPAELSDERRHKIHMIPTLGIFRIKHTDQHVGFGDDLLDDGGMFSEGSAVRVRGIDHQHMFESVGIRG